MASIPLPALAVQTPQPPNQLDNLARIMQLKNAAGQQQIQQQQLQAGGLENQQREMDLKSQQAMMKAYSDAGGDLEKAVPLAAKYGAKPADLVKLKQASLDSQKQAIELLTTKGNRAIQEADMLQGAHDQVMAAPPEQRPAVYQQTLQNLRQAGVDLTGAPPQYPGDQTFQMLGLGLKSHKVMLEDAAKKLDMLQTQAKTGEEQANTAKTQVETANLQQYGGMSGELAKSRYLSVTTKQQQGKPVSPDDQAFVKAYANEKKLVPAYNFNMQNAGAGPGAGGQPNAMAQAIATGQMKWQDVISPRTPMSVKSELLQQVKAINPNFNSGDFAIEQGVKKDFTTGKAGEELNAFNTAIQHADLLGKAATSVGNGDVRAINSLRNRFKTEFGSADVTNFNTIAKVYTGEVTKAITAGHVTDSELQSAGATIPSNASPEQIQGAVQAFKGLMAGKLKIRKQQYEQGLQGKPNFGAAANDTTGGNGFSVTAPNGKNYTFKSQADLDAFKQKAGIK